MPPWGIARRFALEGTVVEVRPHGTGLINDTYLVTTDAGNKGVLQRINANVFQKPEWVQSNLRVLLAHCGLKPKDPVRAFRLPAIVPATDGCDSVTDADGFWRMLHYIEGSVSFDVLTDESQAREMGFALGRFHAWVSDLPPDRMYDTLPGFHVTPGYLERFDQVLAARAADTLADPALQGCLDFIEHRRGGAGVLEQARRLGSIRTRIIHGDPKLNNVLFDRGTGQALSLIDLDTVKPGLIHYDLGDCLRSCCNRAGELGGGDRVAEFDLRLCRAVLDGYLPEAGEFLTEQDAALLFDAIRLIPFELGLRFLTDHLSGDVYFKVSEAGENLRRAWTQFNLVDSIEAQEKAIRELCQGARC